MQNTWRVMYTSMFPFWRSREDHNLRGFIKHWVKFRSGCVSDKFWSKFLKSDERKSNLYQNDEESGQKKVQAHEPKYTTSSVKHGGGSVIAWAWLPVKLADWHLFMISLMAEDECLYSVSSDSVKCNRIVGWHFIIHHLDNDPKLTARATREPLRVKRWYLTGKSNWAVFDLLKAKIKLKVAAMKSWERITREDREHVLEVYSTKNCELGFAFALCVSAQTICVTLNALKGTIYFFQYWYNLLKLNRIVILFSIPVCWNREPKEQNVFNRVTTVQGVLSGTQSKRHFVSVKIK